jgi:hypothetical protein
MYPHCTYFPASHGYYYFRPYHHSHIAIQQHFVRQWGGDPRNPYDNAIFEGIYDGVVSGDLDMPIEPLPSPEAGAGQAPRQHVVAPGASEVPNTYGPDPLVVDEEVDLNNRHGSSRVGRGNGSAGPGAVRR